MATAPIARVPAIVFPNTTSGRRALPRAIKNPVPPTRRWPTDASRTLGHKVAPVFLRYANPALLRMPGDVSLANHLTHSYWIMMFGHTFRHPTRHTVIVPEFLPVNHVILQRAT